MTSSSSTVRMSYPSWSRWLAKEWRVAGPQSFRKQHGPSGLLPQRAVYVGCSILPLACFDCGSPPVAMTAPSPAREVGAVSEWPDTNTRFAWCQAKMGPREPLRLNRWTSPRPTAPASGDPTMARCKKRLTPSRVACSAPVKVSKVCAAVHSSPRASRSARSFFLPNTRLFTMNSFFPI